MAKKRVMTCGKCKGKGHNARTCKDPVKIENSVVKSEIVVTEVEVPDPPATDRREVPERPRRDAPTADRGTAATASPFRCPKCNQVKILAIVRVKDYAETARRGKAIYRGDMRCEACLNQPDPADLILVWGARPDEKVSVETANAI